MNPRATLSSLALSLAFSPLGACVRAPSAPPVAATPRARFSVGGHGGAAVSLGWGTPTGIKLVGAPPSGRPPIYGIGVLGLYLRFGAQFTELFGLELEGSASTLGFSVYGRVALMPDFTPVDWFSVGLGPVVGGNYVSSFFGGGRGSSFAGGSLRLGFHPYTRRGADGARRAFSISLAGDAGHTVSDYPEPYVGAYLMLGYSTY